MRDLALTVREHWAGGDTVRRVAAELDNADPWDPRVASQDITTARKNQLKPAIRELMGVTESENVRKAVGLLHRLDGLLGQIEFELSLCGAPDLEDLREELLDALDGLPAMTDKLRYDSNPLAQGLGRELFLLG